MSSRRIAKVAEALREIVSTVVLFELKDPRVKNVTVLRAEVAPDLRTAKIYVSVMGDEKTRSLSMHGLNAARGFIQSKIADRLQTRYTPVLNFVSDPGIKLSIETAAVIREALATSPAFNAGPGFDTGCDTGAGPGSDRPSRAVAGADGEMSSERPNAADAEQDSNTTEREFDEEGA